MRTAPPLLTERLLLRSLTLEDAPDIQRLAGEYDVAVTLSNMPYPYEDGMAEEWIRSCSEKFEENKALNFAITLRTDRNFIGAIEIRLDPEMENGELGFWVGKPHWGCGYCTEAAKVIVAYGFEVLKLDRICAYHFQNNLASGRVLQKTGMHYEGRIQKFVQKQNQCEDLIGYGMLKADYDSLDPISSNKQSVPI